MNNYSRSEYERTDPHPVAAGMLGALAGAAIGIALASIMADPQKRKIVGRQLQDIQTWGNKTLQDLRDKSYAVQDDLKDHTEEAIHKAERIQKDLEDASGKVQTKAK